MSIKALFSKFRPLMSIGVLAAIATVVIAAVILVPAHDQKDKNWGTLWVSSEDIALTDLPIEAAETILRIEEGGPFLNKGDGARFRNRDKKLPMKPKRYYRVFIVPDAEGKPSKNRIVAGEGPAGNYRKSGEYWFTTDDYETFRRIRK